MTAQMTGARKFQRDYGQADLFIAELLGPRPRRVKDQDRAIADATQALLDSADPRAATAMYFVAVEYMAWSALRNRGARGRPTSADWAQAIALVRGSDEELVPRIRGGMVIKAVSLWRDGTAQARSRASDA